MCNVNPCVHFKKNDLRTFRHKRPCLKRAFANRPKWLLIFFIFFSYCPVLPFKAPWDCSLQNNVCRCQALLVWMGATDPRMPCNASIWLPSQPQRSWEKGKRQAERWRTSRKETVFLLFSLLFIFKPHRHPTHWSHSHARRGWVGGVRIAFAAVRSLHSPTILVKSLPPFPFSNSELDIRSEFGAQLGKYREN